MQKVEIGMLEGGTSPPVKDPKSKSSPPGESQYAQFLGFDINYDEVLNFLCDDEVPMRAAYWDFYPNVTHKQFNSQELFIPWRLLHVILH
ncbi:hypothetical protein ACH5RR_029358 [Cinchona calisaya]|uniref:Uncharacterized protein n=1 Tax=Cinchona calisaya TaxID=153742 RepID=A0ABD2YVV5_9GENT